VFRQHQITVKQVRNCSDIWGISASSVLVQVFIINGSQTVAFLTERQAINSHFPSKLIYSMNLQMKLVCIWTCCGAPGVLCLSSVMKSSVSETSFQAALGLRMIKKVIGSVYSSMEGKCCTQLWAGCFSIRLLSLPNPSGSHSKPYCRDTNPHTAWAGLPASVPTTCSGSTRLVSALPLSGRTRTFTFLS